ncbi:hypothetical protein DFJ73DRAFT_663331 [Zopfochytrium polystomum]|nr:hypothetical protein DFJ73DRAFT_663331 [Zopfochytrium polystomum]
MWPSSPKVEDDSPTAEETPTSPAPRSESFSSSARSDSRPSSIPAGVKRSGSVSASSVSSPANQWTPDELFSLPGQYSGGANSRQHHLGGETDYMDDDFDEDEDGNSGGGDDNDCARRRHSTSSAFVFGKGCRKDAADSNTGSFRSVVEDFAAIELHEDPQLDKMAAEGGSTLFGLVADSAAPAAATGPPQSLSGAAAAAEEDAADATPTPLSALSQQSSDGTQSLPDHRGRDGARLPSVAVKLARRPSVADAAVPGRFFCEWEGCTKSFSTSGHLARHSRIHRNIKPFECNFPGCTSRFARSDK